MDWNIFFEKLFSWETCLFLAVACFGLNSHRRLQEIKKQNADLILMVQKSLSNPPSS